MNPTSSPTATAATSSSGKDLLSRVNVASPCNAAWSEMPGGERVRSCEHCHKKVYNLSAMSAEEATALVREAEGGRSVCVRFYRRSDGTMLTQDCPRGLARVRQRIAKSVAAVFGSILLGGGVLNRAFHTRQQDVPPPPVVTPALMGDVAVAPPPPPPTATMGAIAVTTSGRDPFEPTMGKVAVRPEMGEATVAPTMGRMLVRTPPRRVDLPMAGDTPRKDPFAPRR